MNGKITKNRLNSTVLLLVIFNKKFKMFLITETTVPDTPEAKRPTRPRAPQVILVDSSSDSDGEVSGSSMILMG